MKYSYMSTIEALTTTHKLNTKRIRGFIYQERYSSGFYLR